MKRHKVLQPFSRDHNVGLVLARHLIQNPKQETLAKCVQVWDDEMKNHFEEEELLLVPMASIAMSARLFKEHEDIRETIESARAGTLPEAKIRDLGKKLREHIRWEENELFPAVERSGAIESILEATDAMEARRSNSPHSPRRGELVSRGRNNADHL
ncbi:MAG: hemerythrin domain-containing protein [Fimbriimonadaceae bacterium]|nr:hemerythrin domain-containing protein [Fimbriimonadaceae bacterium]